VVQVTDEGRGESARSAESPVHVQVLKEAGRNPNASGGEFYRTKNSRPLFFGRYARSPGEVKVSVLK